ncbi:hypothetical protein [Klebsiella oxytoca]|uniref:hypothetical protein n=1 Tax=Klebsiella oxytoca TaxID=571 RepID=UPI00190E747D|nr:hypothetical protein [Klebsiella oxytoca]
MILYLLSIQYISCTLAGWRLPETIFIVSAALLWLGIFKYVMYRIEKERPKKVVRDNSVAMILIAGVSALLNPVVCIFLIVLFPLYELNKKFHFLTFKVINSKPIGTANFRRDEGSGRFILNENGEKIPHHITNASNILNESLSDSGNPHLSISSPGGGSLDNVGSYHDCHGLHVPDINPANGLPMVGNVDILGNPYGIDRHD